MAARKSRRDRRLETGKQYQSTENISLAKPIQSGVVSKTKSSQTSGVVDFSTEYFYVYTEVRNILIISVVMFGILFGLGNFI
jgi:hypothetical protein